MPDEKRPACPLSPADIGSCIVLDAASAFKRNARVGERYYEGQNDILAHRIFYFDGDGMLVEDKYASNIKIPHGFFREIVDQKVDYLVSPTERHVTSPDKALDDLLEPYFDDEFNAALTECCTDASKNGSGYLYAWTNEDGDVRFDFAHAMNVVEVRESEESGNCEYVIYSYIDHIGRDQRPVERVIVWDATWTWFFIRTDEGVVPDPAQVENPKPHRKWTDEEGAQWYSGFGQIPMWRLDNNRNRTTDLMPVKPLIDDYDLMKCGLSNSLEDLSEGFFVVKGYSGTEGDLDELITNLRQKKHIGVDSDGGVEVQTVQIPYEARRANMELDKENIYQFGMALNTDRLRDSAATTNMAIKAAYALLDLKCNRFEMRLRALMKRLVLFVLDDINRRESTGYDFSDVELDFDREVMTNKLDNAQTELAQAQTTQTEVATLLNAASTYGDEAVLDAVCDALDLDPDKVRGSSPEPPDGAAGAAAAALSGMGVE